MPLKGYKQSDEHRRKTSESKKGENHPNYGKPRSVETRKRISEANKGQIPWNKGKTGVYSEETLRKKSEAQKRNTAAFKKGHVPWNKGKTEVYSEDSLRKMSEANKGKVPWNKGKHHSEETLKKLSEAMKGKYHSMKTRRKMSEARKGDKNPRWLGGISFKPYGIEFNDELKQSIRERDNFTCQICDTKQEELKRELCIHHIDYMKTNNNPTNLLALCLGCHIKTNSNREYWTHFFMETNGKKNIQLPPIEIGGL